MPLQDNMDPMALFTSRSVARHITLYDTADLTIRDAAGALVGDPTFRRALIDLLRDSPARAYRWEMPAITPQTADRPFEFALVDDPHLDRPARIDAFRAHLDGPGQTATFTNLGGDALLVVPTPRAEASHYTHLARFVRGAPDGQVHALWAEVGRVLGEQLTHRSRPLWLSTAGGGVPWLHVRFDDRPKYYAYRPYRQAR